DTLLPGGVVVFGDSRGFAWPSPAGHTLINRSISGQTTAECLLRLEAHVLPLKPRQVVIQLGVNDLKAVALFPPRRDTIVTNCQTNLRDIVRRLTEAGAQVILCTIFPPGDLPFYRIPFWSDEIIPAILTTNAYLKTLASDQVIILDAYALLTDPATGRVYPAYQYDFLHLNTAGYEVLNTALVPLLQP
ncbi:MAG: GDSL-type esterase/lipase family protein, partial [Bacteroidia bacterium]|nr:GDSL-type esterase/lipase family protein [Bacteroidia bacterium]